MEEVVDHATVGLADVHVVAETTAAAHPIVILPAPCFAEISHGRKLDLQLLARVETARDGFHGRGGVFFVLVFDVHVAHHVVAKILRHVDRFQVAMLGGLDEHFFVERIEPLLHPRVELFHLLGPRLFVVGHVQELDLRVQPHVLHEQRLRELWLVVAATALVPMPARAHFVVVRAVDAVQLGAMDSGQFLSATTLVDASRTTWAASPGVVMGVAIATTATITSTSVSTSTPMATTMTTVV